MFKDLRDPRRAGFVAIVFSGAYLAFLFIPESLTFRVAFATGIFAFWTAFFMLVPLPRWRESEDRQRLAAKWMTAEAVVIMVLGTVVRWWTA